MTASPKKKNVFSSIKAPSLSSRIVDQVIEALFAKQLKAGQFLGTEAQLAEMFQTSRMPIREALSRLEALGVLSVKQGAGGGATIAQGEPDQFATALAVQFMLIEATVEEIFDARIAIETRAAELAAEQATADDFAALEAAYEHIAAPRTEGRAAVQHILDFHIAVVDASHSRTLISLMHGLGQPLVNLYLHPNLELAGRRGGYGGLREILDRLKARDPIGARDKMHDHLVAQRSWVVSRLIEGGGA